MNPATLSDGTVVDSSSPEWRLECEAKAILRLEFNLRKSHLEDIEKKRGTPARKELEAAIVRIWTAGRVQT